MLKPVKMSNWLNWFVRSNTSQSAIDLSVDGQQQAVILSVEVFKQLLSGNIYAEYGQLFEPEFRQQFQQALVEAGFDTREKIIDFAREVKRDVAEEYTQMFTSTPLPPD